MKQHYKGKEKSNKKKEANRVKLLAKGIRYTWINQALFFSEHGFSVYSDYFNIEMVNWIKIIIHWEEKKCQHTYKSHFASYFTAFVIVIKNSWEN